MFDLRPTARSIARNILGFAFNPRKESTGG